MKNFVRRAGDLICFCGYWIQSQGWFWGNYIRLVFMKHGAKRDAEIKAFNELLESQIQEWEKELEEEFDEYD